MKNLNNVNPQEKKSIVVPRDSGLIITPDKDALLFLAGFGSLTLLPGARVAIGVQTQYNNTPQDITFSSEYIIEQVRLAMGTTHVTEVIGTTHEASDGAE